jgi:archaemetzincin
MKVGVLEIGQIAPDVLRTVAEGLARTFPETSTTILKTPLLIPQQSFDRKRSQYNSSIILNELRKYAERRTSFHRILAVVDVDLYASGLNYVFGEAFAPGRVGVISLWRLRPEFYGEQEDLSVYHTRILKEAAHELGHTLGLQHCHHSYCVMHFSNSIFDTDKKQTLFCDQCSLQAAIAISNIGKTL